jgi:DNA repair photolyase
MEGINIIIETVAKSLLTKTKDPNSWFGVMYNMNIYRGCQHKCIYCDSRSLCYRIDNFDDVIVKANAIELLEKELKGKRTKGVIGTGAMSDPYTWCERQYNLTGKALQVIEAYGFPIHIVTKNSLILRDIETLKKINNKARSTIAFTITTTDDNLAKVVEPGAPVSSERFRAMHELSKAGILTGVTMMPILPFIEDNEENIVSIVHQTAENGGKFIIPWFGMSLRDRQRDYYYRKLDIWYPGLRQKYESSFGESYSCSVKNAKRLKAIFYEECKKLNIQIDMGMFKYEDKIEQLKFF